MMKKFAQILVSSENKTIWMDSPIECKHPSQSLREILNAKFLSDLESKAFPKVAKFYLPVYEFEAARQMDDLIAAQAFNED